MAKKIDESTLAILSRVTVDGNKIFLTCGQLDRKQYQAVNEVLENMSGKWDRKAKAHFFGDDPTDRLEQVLLSGEIVPPKKYGYFPTPSVLAEEVVAQAKIVRGMTVLEPSAGRGALAIPAARVTGKENVFCYELLDDNCAELQKHGLQFTQSDFLTINPSGGYDRVVMNPPFDKQSDIDHVSHAWKFVKPGGRLVSIMTSGVLFRGNRKTTEFREMVEKHGGIERLPKDSFKEFSTGVNTVLVAIDRP